MPAKKPDQDNPLANILINVIIPVLALSFLSKDPEFQRSINKPVEFWHIGPTNAILVALTPPIAYGIWYFIKVRKFNFFSALGLFSVLLTGLLTLFLWNKDGTIKPHADILFGLKEGSIPLILGIAVIGSHWTRSPLLRAFIYNDTIFDVPKIEQKVKELQVEEGYQKVLYQATVLLGSAFFISTLLNFGLAMYFLGDLDHLAPNAREVYNAQVGKITGWGFAVIGAPTVVFLFVTLRRLMAGLQTLTGLSDKEISSVTF